MNMPINQDSNTLSLNAGLPVALPESSHNHKVSAIYATRDEADRVRQLLIDGGVGAGDVAVLQDLPLPPDEGDNDEVLKDMLVDGVVGTAVGTGVGALGTVVLWAASVTLFVASPLVAPLAMLGWFASVGGIAGAVAGAVGNETKKGKEGKFSELVMDVIKSGNVVLVVRTHGEADKALAKDIITKSLAGHTEVVTESN